MKRLFAVLAVLWWCGERSMAQHIVSAIRTVRVAERIEAYSAEGVFMGAFKASLLNTVYPVPTIIGDQFLDSKDLRRTDSASVGTGAWRVEMNTSADSISRYLVIIKTVPAMTVPASINTDFRVPTWVTNRVRVAESFFRDDVPVVNSGLDTIFASASYQTSTLQFPSVTGQVNQWVLWVSYMYGEEGHLVLFFDQVVAPGGVVLENGEAGADVTAPGAPSGMTLTATSATSADARATAPADADVGGVVFELDTSPAFTNPTRVIAFATPGVEVVNTFINLAPSTLYYCRAAARDVSANQGTFSAVDTAMTFTSTGSGLPGAPTSFVLTGASSSSVVAVFEHGVGAMYTEVQLTEGLSFGSSYSVQLVAATPGAPGFAIFTGLPANRTFAGRARSVNQDGLSAYAPQDTGRTFTVTTGVEKWSEAPHAFALHGNFPNPFNPTTMIRYDVGEEAVVSITVYDVLGRTMDELLLRELRGPGRYDVTWNASAHPSGIYFCRMEAGRFTATTKMLLVR